MGGVALGEAVRASWGEMWAHKLRSGLTLVGVILGTLAMVLMVILREGVKVMVWEGFRGLGFDGVRLVSGRPPQDPVEGKKQGFSRGLTAGDLAVQEEWGESLTAVAAARFGEKVVAAPGVPRGVRVFGVTPSCAAVPHREVQAGRWLALSDQEERRKVAVLGAELAETLFGSDNPVG